MNKQWMASIAGVLILALVALGAPLAAQDAPDEDPTVAKFNQEWESLDPEMRADLERLIEVSGARKQIQEMFSMMGDRIESIVEGKMMELGTSDPRIRDLGTEYMSRMAKMMIDDIDELPRPWMVTFARHYTLDEIRQLNAFYESPVGKKLIDTNPEMVGGGMDGIFRVIMRRVDALDRELLKQMETLKREIEAENIQATPEEERPALAEASAVERMRLLVTCSIVYQTGHPDMGYPARLNEMGPHGDRCIDGVLGTGRANGYVFEYRPTGPIGAGPIYTGFSVIGKPQEYGKDGKRSYYADDSGVIRVTTEDRPATVNDPPL